MHGSQWQNKTRQWQNKFCCARTKCPDTFTYLFRPLQHCSSSIFFSDKHSSKTIRCMRIVYIPSNCSTTGQLCVVCMYRKFVSIRCIWRTPLNSQLMARGNIAYPVQKKFPALINQRSELRRDELTIPVKGPYLRK